MAKMTLKIFLFNLSSHQYGRCHQYTLSKLMFPDPPVVPPISKYSRFFLSNYSSILSNPSSEKRNKDEKVEILSDTTKNENEIQINQTPNSISSAALNVLKEQSNSQMSSAVLSSSLESSSKVSSSNVKLSSGLTHSDGYMSKSNASSSFSIPIPKSPSNPMGHTQYRDQILSFLNKHHIQYKFEHPYYFVLSDCPVCHPSDGPVPTKSTSSLAVNVSHKSAIKIQIYQGIWHCSLCSSKGKWDSLLSLFMSEIEKGNLKKNPLLLLSSILSTSLSEDSPPTSSSFDTTSPSKSNSISTSSIGALKKSKTQEKKASRILIPKENSLSKDKPATQSTFSENNISPSSLKANPPTVLPPLGSLNSFYNQNWSQFPELQSWIDSHQLRLETLGAFDVGFQQFSTNINDPELESLPLKDTFIAYPELYPTLSLLNTLGAPAIYNGHIVSQYDKLDSSSTSSLKSRFDLEKNILLSAIHFINIHKPKYQRIEKIGTEVSRGIFGLRSMLQAISVGADRIVITSNEIDAMIVYQETRIPCVCFPTGLRKFPNSLLSIFDAFRKIYLWIADPDANNIIEQLSQQFGKGRCRLVMEHSETNATSDTTGILPSTSILNPLAVLELGKSFSEALERAQPMNFDKIWTFGKYKQLIQYEFEHPENFIGIQSRTLPSLNKILKGLRRGELTIFTGPTGSGKTSILSQLSLDYASQGVPTLWGSFEIPNQKLLKKMIRQYAEKDFTNDTSDFDDWAKKFHDLPLYFMNFFGSSYLEDVLDAMNYAVDAFGAQYIILDNLQFMLSGQERGNFDKWDLLDRTVAKIREFCHRRNVHIALVIHPRKEPDDTLLGIASVTGTAKSTQEADNLVILQKIGKKRFLDIRKNRYDGQLGRIVYEYDPTSLMIYEQATLDLDANEGSKYQQMENSIQDDENDSVDFGQEILLLEKAKASLAY